MKITKIAAICLLSTSLTGCAATAIFAGAEAAKTIAQDRSTGSRIDDNGIALRINDAFIQKDIDDLYAGVSTTIIEGRVLLTGTIQNPQFKTDAEEMVWAVPGVKEVINEIQITNENSITDFGNDVWISNYIRSKLLVTKGIGSSNYYVDTTNANVYLMGIARDEEELRNAIEVARRVGGVEKVISHVILRDDPRRSQWSTARNSYF